MKAITSSLLLLSLLGESIAFGQAPRQDCVSVANDERVTRGQSFYRELPGGLELRLNAYELTSPPSGVNANAWMIVVSPADDRGTDYMWVVSPPWGTAPHIIIGAGYGLSGRESLQFGDRDFRFVLNASDYAEAMKNEEDFKVGRLKSVDQQLRRLGRGTLKLQVRDFHIQSGADGKDTDFIEWFTFTATACVPKP